MAQRLLGLMYYEGQGVAKDLVAAHMWINLAAVNGDANVLKLRGIVAKEMTPTQLAEAQKLASEWKPKVQ